MVTRIVSSIYPNVTKMWGRDASRVCVTISEETSALAGYQGEIELYDQEPNSTRSNYFYRMKAGETLTLSALEGHDVTTSYWMRSRDSAITQSWVQVKEEFLDMSIMEKLQQAGIESTQGLPFLILAALASG